MGKLKGKVGMDAWEVIRGGGIPINIGRIKGTNLEVLTTSDISFF